MDLEESLRKLCEDNSVTRISSIPTQTVNTVAPIVYKKFNTPIRVLYEG